MSGVLNLGLTNVTTSYLITLLSTPGVIEDNASAGGHTGVAYTDSSTTPEGGTIHLIEGRAYTSHLYATLIHETFHLFNKSGGSQIVHSDMDAAMAAADAVAKGGWGPYPGFDDPRTGYIDRYCGGHYE